MSCTSNGQCMTRPPQHTCQNVLIARASNAIIISILNEGVVISII